MSSQWSALVVLLVCSMYCCLTPAAAQTSCDPHCASACTKQGAGKCDQKCVAGWGLNLTSFTCSGGCDPLCNGSCNIWGPGTCDKFCVAGYGVDSTTHLCAPCQRACLTTSTCSRCGAGTCDSGCITGYSLNNCSCAMCDLNCMECPINGYLKCDPGKCKSLYALDTKYNTCAQCDANCATNCSTPGTCAVGGCKTGYADLASGTDNICAACDANCLGTCSAAGKCDGTCKTGYSLDPVTKTCSVCARNCTSGCSVEGAGFCDSSCAKGTAWNATLNNPNKHACYPCATYCTSGCTRKGCCDAPVTCSKGTPGTLSTDSTCGVCL